VSAVAELSGTAASWENDDWALIGIYAYLRLRVEVAGCAKTRGARTETDFASRLLGRGALSERVRGCSSWLRGSEAFGGRNRSNLTFSSPRQPNAR